MEPMKMEEIVQAFFLSILSELALSLRGRVLRNGNVDVLTEEKLVAASSMKDKRTGISSKVLKLFKYKADFLLKASTTCLIAHIFLRS